MATCQSHGITKGGAVTRPGLGLALPCTCFHSQSCSDLLESHGSGTTAVSPSRETHCTAGSGVKTLGSDPAPAPQQLSDSEHRPQPPYEFPGAALTNHDNWVASNNRNLFFILSWFWKPGVQNEGVIRAVFLQSL